MPHLCLALAQVDATVGDLAGNGRLILDAAMEAAAEGADVVVFPEMVLTGYPAEDLVLRPSFIAASRNALEQLASALADAGVGQVAVVVGYLDATPSRPALGAPTGLNAAAVLHGGRVVARYAKHHLPNYGVFDEARYFSPGTNFPVVTIAGVDVALTICEDLWQAGGPIPVARLAGAGLVLCLNGSPYEQGKSADREQLAARRAAEAGAPIAYVNMVGGQDELVFDGGSFVVDEQGALLARAAAFESELLVVDLDLPAASSMSTGPVDALDGSEMTISRTHLSDEKVGRGRHDARIASRLGPLEEVYQALVTGTRDYVRKNGFSRVLLGLSGGIDSALVATIAADALGAENVRAIALPSRHSSEHSIADAAELAARQGIGFEIVPIDPMVTAFEAQISPTGLAAENLQARVRGTTLMALSNQHGALVVTTGNKSELATGFSTLYGDTAGAFAPIKDVPKTLVWELSRWRNSVAAATGAAAPIPENSIEKPPSAELAPDQLDSDRLPDYALLDAILQAYVETDLDRTELARAGFDPAIVDRVVALVDSAEYKRRQYPPGPKISLRAFGRDRRLPISSRWREPSVGD